MKKMLSSLLALVLLLSCFAGLCENETELTKITASLNIHSEDVYEEGLAFLNEIAARFGLEVELITFSDDIAGEKTNTLLASGNLPELFFVRANTANLYGAEGKFVVISEVLDELPNFAALIEIEQPLGRMSSDGKLYYMPKYSALYATTEGNMTYRKDILEALGETEPTDVEGWYELYKKVHEAYPDMIVLSERHANIQNQMASVFGMATIKNFCGVVAQGSDREVVYLPTTENWKEMLEWYNRLYEEGILYQGYTTIDYSNWWDQGICTDKVFACNTMNFNRAYEATSTAQANGFEGVEWWVALQPNNPITDTNEVLLCNSAWQDMGMAIPADCECLDKVLPFIDYFYSQEFLDFQDQRYAETQLGFYFLYWAQYEQNFYVNSDISVMKDHFSKNSPLVELVPVLAGNNEGAQRIIDECEGLEDYVRQMRDEFIRGSVSFDEWDNYVEKCQSLGCDVAVEIVQGYLDEYYAVGN